MPKTVAAFGGTEALQAFNSRAHDPLTPYFAATFAAFIPRPVLPGLSEKRFNETLPALFVLFSPVILNVITVQNHGV